jgi:Porin subfamily
MTITKRMLLGSVAALTAISSTQAADLPVKAQPVQYVKICDLYGAGFYYIPGSDICLKIGGYVQADYGWNVTGARTPHYSGGAGAQDRTVNPYSTRNRASFNFDSRSQTSYGTLRTYVAIHINNENIGTVDVTLSRGFIQWAGFTFGHTKSLTDVPGTPAPDTFRSLHQSQNISDTSGAGTNQIAYTWELGNGMTFNVGADERRTKALANLSNTVINVGSNPATAFGPYQHPTPWVNFAVNQAWGRFATSAIFNKLNATYYTAGCAQTGTSQCDYPDDKWGWAVLNGIDIKVPSLGPGDHIGGYFLYGQGAASYSAGNNLNSPGLFGGNNQVALGVLTDAVYVNGGQLELTTGWGAGGGYEHFWLPNFSTTVYGTYTQVRYNDTVINDRLFCAGSQNVRVAATVACDPGFNFWTVGTHTDWYPVPGFRLAVDVLYTRIETAFEGEQVTLTKAQGARPTGAYTAKDQGILSVVFRANRAFGTAE